MDKNKHLKNNQGTLLVTMALPYANGDIHLGHLVEAIQTDIFVRYTKMAGRKTVFVCADDTHGTPIQINAMKLGITPQELIANAWKNHVKDYKYFSIGFDTFYTTDSPENRYWSELIFEKMKKKGLIKKKEIEQYYCKTCKRFLPDRFIKGTCPKCQAEDQYGDVCESCGATYDPVDLKDSKCVICEGTPVLKKSKHFFVQLAKEENFLKGFLNETPVLQDDMKNFVMRWVEDGLKEWCISRDGPYFGFEIPNEKNKYFYVWLDAPIGYIAATEKWCKENNQDVHHIWDKDTPGEIIHFIGKDIIYFHSLFWPVMLHAASLKLPQKEFVHGFLTVEGEKMSKSRGTFILASQFVNSVKHPWACEYLRFYYGAKLTNNTADIDLNIDEFCNKINTILVNNIGNLHHRTSVFLDRYFDSQVPDVEWDENIKDSVEKAALKIVKHFQNVEFKAVIENIQALGSLGNKYYQDTKPWELIKKNKEEASQVMVTCINLVKACAVFLKPFIPNIIKKLEKQFQKEFQWDDYFFSLRGIPLGKTEKIVVPIEKSEFNALFGQKEEKPSPISKKAKGNELITIKDFNKIKLRVGIVKDAQKIEKSEKLLKLSIDDGQKTRQIIAGLAKKYTSEEIKGKSIVFISNLQPIKIMGLKSEGMVLAAQEGDKMALLHPDKDISAGALIS